MLDIEEIDNTIETLENGSTTFDNVLKLASLYIVKEHMQNAFTESVDAPERELNDVLPAYRKYKDIKRDFQLGNSSKDNLISTMKSVCTELKEFITTLHHNTECEECRNLIQNMIKSLDL